MDMAFFKVAGPALPKERCIKVDKASEKNGSEKKPLTREAPPPIHKILNYFGKLSPKRVPGH